METSIRNTASPGNKPLDGGPDREQQATGGQGPRVKRRKHSDPNPESDKLSEGATEMKDDRRTVVLGRIFEATTAHELLKQHAHWPSEKYFAFHFQDMYEWALFLCRTENAIRLIYTDRGGYDNYWNAALIGGRFMKENCLTDISLYLFRCKEGSKLRETVEYFSDKPELFFQEGGMLQQGGVVHQKSSEEPTHAPQSAPEDKMLSSDRYKPLERPPPALSDSFSDSG